MECYNLIPPTTGTIAATKGSKHGWWLSKMHPAIWLAARGRTIFAAFLLLAVPTMMVTFMVERVWRRRRF